MRTYSYYLAMTSVTVMDAGICFNCNDYYSSEDIMHRLTQV